MSKGKNTKQKGDIGASTVPTDERTLMESIRFNSHLSEPEQKAVAKAAMEESRLQLKKRDELLHTLRVGGQQTTIFGTAATPAKVRCDQVVKNLGAPGVYPSPFGQQPANLEVDDDTIAELREHSFQGMVDELLRSTKPPVGDKRKAAAKQPHEMAPYELIQWREKHSMEWDAFCKRNAVISFGIVKPSDAEKKKAQTLLKKNLVNGKAKKKGLMFEKVVETREIPAGRDHSGKETTKKSKTVLKK